jgi:hypothetical protein
VSFASDRSELNRWQAVEESSSAAGDHRPYREPEFVDNVGGEQRLRDRDTCVDADIASALLLEIPNEFDQPPSIAVVVVAVAGSTCGTPRSEVRR